MTLYNTRNVIGEFESFGEFLSMHETGIRTQKSPMFVGGTMTVILEDVFQKLVYAYKKYLFRTCRLAWAKGSLLKHQIIVLAKKTHY